jgi:DNA-binding MurR/RpiR family transcriptional regulator
VPIIAITSNREGNVAKLADFNLFVSPTEYTYSAGKFTSRLSQLIVVDILYLTYLQWTYKTSYSTLAETQINHIEADIK